jgi:predicted nucleic acid-binding protein
LYSALQNAFAEVSRSEQDDVVSRFIRRHVSDWLGPLRDEQKAAYDWRQLLNDAVRVAKYDYAKGYLNNPDKYDTFNRALAELLTLLEIPGLANSLARTRALVTWPARKLLGVGRSVLAGSVNLGTGMGKGSKLQVPDQEADTLVRILDKSLTHLQTQLLEKADNSAQQALWWRSLNHSFRQREPLIRQAFTRESERARAEFEPRIEAAAHQLYEQLQSQPVLLNTVRATRVTADAAGIALALKSGGLAPADLILAPAMLSVTTLLTESALGRYMDLIKNELKQEQQKHINARLLDGLLTTELEAVARHLNDDSLFTTNLDPSIKRALDDMRTREASSFV